MFQLIYYIDCVTNKMSLYLVSADDVTEGHNLLWRLENGLEKLRSTASQVDDLKKTLAVQEVELAVKNEAADKLIEMVGVETAKVQHEKQLGEAL